MIEKKTVLDQIEITRSGAVQFRIGLLYVEDGVEGEPKWHRSIINPGDDAQKQIAAVGAHLAAMGRDGLSNECAGKLMAHVATAHTPDVIKAFKVAAEESAAKHADLANRPAPKKLPA